MQIFITCAEKQPIFSSEEFSQLLSVLPMQRQQKIKTIKNEPQRQMSMLASLLLTNVICHTLSTTPNELRFDTNAHGKPFLPDFPTLQFSLTHSGLCAAVATDLHPIGIDVEQIRPYPQKIPSRFFAFDEQYFVQTADTDNAFFQIWTQKEAYVKRNGHGFFISPESFSVMDPSIAPLFYTKKYNDYMVSLCVDEAHLPLDEGSILWQAYTPSDLCRFFLS